MAEAAVPGAGRPARSMSSNSDLSLGSPYRAAWRLTGFFFLVCAVAVVQVTCMALKSRLANVVPMLYHRICCRLLDVRIELRGSVSKARPTLFVCNHSSYLDISALGSIINGSFVAKAEVANWPVFGFLAKLQRTVFVDRRRHTAHRQRDDLARRLEAGDNLILFPEGTSNDGNRTLPFRSALFGVAERKIAGEAHETILLSIQPVSIAYVRLNGVPIGRSLRPYFAWYGDMDLFGHLWRVAGLGRTTVVIEFHAPVTLRQFGSRKALSDYCQRIVAEGVAAAVAGRWSAEPPSGETLKAAPQSAAKQYT
jgi:1-acyl-sn-glycerol-3-phosphate acyltransferase